MFSHSLVSLSMSCLIFSLVAASRRRASIFSVPPSSAHGGRHAVKDVLAAGEREKSAPVLRAPPRAAVIFSLTFGQGPPVFLDPGFWGPNFAGGLGAGGALETPPGRE